MMTTPNYIKQQAKDLQAGKIARGQAVIAHVYHDDWCAIFRGGVCNCNPKIEYERVDDTRKVH